MEIPWGTDEYLDESQFYNRTDDLEFLRGLLNSTQFGSSPTILLTGVRGVGKTALINQLKRDFEDEYLVISLNLSATDSYQKGKLTREGFMKKLYAETIKSCEEMNIIDTISTKVKKFFKTNNIKLKENLLKIENITLPLPIFSEDYTKLAEFIMDLPQEIYDAYSQSIKGVFIFIDEFQNIKDLYEMESFLWYLRSKVQSQKNVAYLFSGSISIKDSLIGDIAGKKGAFGGRMLTVHIEPFSYETTKSYLNQNASYLNFTEDGMKRFYMCSRGIPYYINTFAKLISRDKVLDENTVIFEFKKTLRFLAIHLINQWDQLTFQEQNIIVQLLNGPLKRVEIAKKLNITSGSISKPLRKLMDNVLIDLNDDGKYDIADSILRAWLKNEFAKHGVYPFRSL